VVVEGTYDRIAVLSKIPDSCFLSARVYPCVKMYVARHGEDTAIREIQECIATVSKIVGIQLGVSIGISPLETPNINTVLTFLRGFPHVVRAIILASERTPSEIVTSVSRWDGKSRYEGNCDVMPVVNAVTANIGGDFAAENLLPLSSFKVLEPLLPTLGYPQYSLHPYFWSLFGTVLVSTTKIGSAPLSDLFDLYGLYDDLCRLDLKISPDGSGPGFLKWRSIKKAIKARRTAQAVATKVVPDDVLEYLTDEKKEPIATETVRRSQFLLIQNQMDSGNIDLIHRVHCSNLTLKTDTDNRRGSLWISGPTNTV
jgi:hypothetical protein